MCGSRAWSDQEPIRDVLAQLVADHGDDLVVVHGGARGADTHVHDIANEMGIEVEVYLADWEKYGRGAGYLRNNRMLNTGPNLVVAFHLENSPGTKHTVSQARDRGIPVQVVYASH